MSPLPPNKNDREQDKFLWDPVRGVVVKVDGNFSGNVNFKAPTGPFLITNHTIGMTAVDPLPTPLTGRVSLSIRNRSTIDSIYFGADNTVTADDTATGGWQIGPREDFNIDLDATNSFYLIASTSGIIVKILQIAST